MKTLPHLEVPTHPQTFSGNNNRDYNLTVKIRQNKCKRFLDIYFHIILLEYTFVKLFSCIFFKLFDKHNNFGENWCFLQNATF